MSYTPYTWQRGDVITSEKLNHIESGIESASAGGVFWVTFSYSDETYEYSKDKTYTEIATALINNNLVLGKYNGSVGGPYFASSQSEVGGEYGSDIYFSKFANYTPAGAAGGARATIDMFIIKNDDTMEFVSFTAGEAE